MRYRNFTHRNFFCSLFTPLPCLLLPKSYFDSLDKALSHLSAPFFLQGGDTRGTGPFPRSSPGLPWQAPPCSTRCRCCAAFVPPAHPCFPGWEQLRAGTSSPSSAQLPLLKHRPGREVPSFCSHRSSPWVTSVPGSSLPWTQPGHAGFETQAGLCVDFVLPAP